MKVFRFIKYAFLICLAGLILKTCIPAHYNVQQQRQRAGTQYWDLATGSHIAYTLIPAKGAKKPYPIIYLHGGPGGPIYDRNVELLSAFAEDGYDVYLYDQIGGGLSARLDNIEEYTADRHVRDLAEIVRKTGAPKVILIGQSWGGILAILFAADHQEMLEKIVFSCPGPIQPIHRELAGLASPDSFHLRDPYFTNAAANKSAATLRSDAVWNYAFRFGRKLASDAEMDDFATYLSAGTGKSVVCDTTKLPKTVDGGGGYYVQVMTVKSLQDVADPRPKLQNSGIPVLVMKGQCDNQQWGYTQEYLQVFPRHQLVVVPDAGHAIGLEQPEIYVKTIRAFLQE